MFIIRWWWLFSTTHRSGISPLFRPTLDKRAPNRGAYSTSWNILWTILLPNKISSTKSWMGKTGQSAVQVCLIAFIEVQPGNKAMKGLCLGRKSPHFNKKRKRWTIWRCSYIRKMCAFFTALYYKIFPSNTKFESLINCGLKQ